MTLFLRLSNLNSISRLAIRRLFFALGRCNILAFLIIDVASKFEIQVTLGRRSSGSGTIGGCQRLASRDRRLRTGLEGL